MRGHVRSLKRYTPQQLEEAATRVIDAAEAMDDGQALILILAGALLACIKSAKESTVGGKVPSDLLRLETALDETLTAGVPIIMIPLAERISTAMKARAN